VSFKILQRIKNQYKYKKPSALEGVSLNTLSSKTLETRFAGIGTLHLIKTGCRAS